MELVLDTFVLKVGQNADDERSLDVLALLHGINSSHTIAVDYGHLILGEYFRNIPSDCHAGKWLGVVSSRSDKLVFRDGRVTNVHRDILLNQLHFDRSDLVFVGVAARTPDRILVSEESDYSENIKEYLLDEIGVRVVSIHEALQLIQG